MSTATRPPVDRYQLSVIATLASLLDKLENSRTPVDPDQYRAVVTRLEEQLDAVAVDDAVRAVLGASPAAAELYENLQYAHAGLCLRPLERALTAEMRAREWIDRAKAC